MAKPKTTTTPVTASFRIVPTSPDLVVTPDTFTLSAAGERPPRPPRPDWPERPDRPPIEWPDRPPKPPEPVSDFDPRTMTIEQIEAATGLQIPVSELKKADGFNVTEPGTYEGFDYTGRVTIQLAGGKVTFRNCRFQSPGDWYTIINKPDEYLADEIRFEHCEMSYGVNTVAGSMMYLYRCAMTRWENGVNIWGPSQIVECYIHSPEQITEQPHFDGVECNGGDGHDIKILRSYIWNNGGQTAALMFNNEFGPLKDIEVDGNWLGGGGYTIYVDNRKNPANPVENMRFTNNTIKSGSYGHLSLYDSGVEVTEADGNVFI